MPGLHNPVATFNADRTHANLYRLAALEPGMLRTLVEATLDRLPKHARLVEIVQSSDRTYVLAAILNEDGSPHRDGYTHWMLCPDSSAPKHRVTQAAFLNNGSYGHRTLTEAVASLSERVGIEV